MKNLYRWLATAMVFAMGTMSAQAASPSIQITQIPVYGSNTFLSGVVLNGNPATQAVAVFIDVPGYGWVTKPTCAKPLTPIRANGSWTANVTTGGAGDLTATRYAALVVPNNFNFPCVLGSNTLPAELYAQALAKTVVRRPTPGVRFLSFAGYDWWVKNYPTPVPPGPNYFSDSTENAWTDSNGWLHLRITYRNNAWQSAEIISARTFGLGHYRFELNTSVDRLDPSVTLGLFTWSDDPAFTYREIDVECGRWQNPADTNNSQFVVQPYPLPNHLVRYRVPPEITHSTQSFIWETNRITWQCHAGPYVPDRSNLVASYVFDNAADVPQSGDENVRLNLWLTNGAPPTDNQEVEVVIRDFNFVPLGPLPEPRLQRYLGDGVSSFQWEFAVQPDYRFELQSSSDMVHWLSLSTQRATSPVLRVSDLGAPAVDQRFYRILTLP